MVGGEPTVWPCTEARVFFLGLLQVRAPSRFAYLVGGA